MGSGFAGKLFAETSNRGVPPHAPVPFALDIFIRQILDK
jgi:hypothetical protein